MSENKKMSAFIKMNLKGNPDVENVTKIMKSIDLKNGKTYHKIMKD